MFDNIYIQPSDSKGRGIFANKNFYKNDIINISYSWEISPSDIEFFSKTSIGGYWFDHPDKLGYGLIPIGSAALVNHSTNPNAHLVWKNTDIGYTGILTAVLDIFKDQEIFINYGVDIYYD